MSKQTIKEIAEKSGVSISTVSRVMNNPEQVSDELRQKVQSVIEEVGFTPNSLARSLKLKQTHTIGVIIVDLQVPFFAAMVQHLEISLREQGYLMLVAAHHDDPNLEKKCLETMMEMQVDGIIITATNQNDKLLDHIWKSGMPLIMLDRRCANPAIPAVHTDKRKGFYQLMEHLYQLGHREFALVTGDKKIVSNHDRFLGVVDFLYDNDIPLQALHCYYGSFTEQYGYQIAEKVFTKKQSVTAILTGSSAIAAGVYHYCNKHHIDIPRDVSITSLGNFEHPDLIQPALTYIDDMRDELGKLTADILQKMLISKDRKKETYQSMMLEAEIIIGESTAAMRLDREG